MSVIPSHHTMSRPHLTPSEYSCLLSLSLANRRGTAYCLGSHPSNHQFEDLESGQLGDLESGQLGPLGDLESGNLEIYKAGNLDPLEI